jgi:tape measure domain-containing protein
MQDSTVTITITAIDGATKVFQGVGDTAVKQANRAAAAWQKANDVQNVSIESTGSLGRAAGNAARQQDRLTASTRRSYFAQTALTTILSAGINKAFLEMVDVTGQAIQRVDLIANFPKSMEALGLSAQDASESLKTLTNYIGSIGGNLQDATTSVARFAEVTKNVKAATAEFVGVNNALIAGGAGTEVQKNGLEQLIQAYSRGIPQLIEWRSLMVAMPAQLNQVAKAMNFVNAQALGEALTNGKVSMQDFLTELTKLSTGTGPIAQQALARMNGIQFAFNVLKNTMVQGMTAIIQTIGRQNIISFFQLLTGVVQQLAVWAVRVISILFSLFNVISRVFGGPQLKLANDNTAGIADNLGGAADNANDLADGLDDAAKAANKSLASFDKMNVLDKGSAGKDKTPSAAGAPLSAADAAALGDIFSGIGGELPKISQAAKVLAGILAGIAGIKFAESLLNQFNGVVKTVKEASKNVGDFKKALFGTTDEGGKKVDGLVQKLGKIGSKAKEAGNTIGTALISGIVGALAASARAVLAFLAPIGAVIVAFFTDLVLTVAVALGVSVGAAIAIIIAIVAAVIAIVALIVIFWDQIMNALKIAAQAVWDFLVAGWNLLVAAIAAIWNFLYDIFAAPIKWLLQFVEAMFILIVAIIAIAIQVIVGIFVFLVKGIFEILSAVAGWIFDNVITPIVNFFTEMWNKLVDLVTATWDWILNKILLPIANWINVNVITPVFNIFSGLWNGIVNLVRGFWNNVMNILGPFATWINNNVIQPVLGFFNGLWNAIKNGLSNMLNGLASLFGGLGNIVKAPINGIIDILNDVLKGLNKIKVPDWVPGIGGKGVNFPMIPKLAHGGIVTRSQLVNVGEAGTEAIVPLENNLEWIDKLADKINSASGGAGGRPIQLTVQIGEDKVATKIIDLINEKTQMSGRNAILV